MVFLQQIPSIRGDGHVNIDVSQLNCEFVAPDPPIPLPEPLPENPNLELLDVWDAVAPHILNLVAARSIQYTSMWCIENDIWITVLPGSAIDLDIIQSISQDIVALVKRFGVAVEHRGIAIKIGEGKVSSLDSGK